LDKNERKREKNGKDSRKSKFLMTRNQGAMGFRAEIAS